MKHSVIIIISIVSLFLLNNCMPTKVVRELNTPGKFTANSKVKFLKVHMNDGSLFILDDWEINTISKTISGTGSCYNYKRDKISMMIKRAESNSVEVYNIGWDDVSLIETNQLLYNSGNLAAIMIPGVPLAILAAYCAINPKACFGSCPTFYTMNNGQWSLVAEGFSSSILPVFEKEDIDMLYWTENCSNRITVKLTNEALETHVIRYVNLQVFPKSNNSRIFSTQEGEFYRVKNLQAPVKCEGMEGNCLDKVILMDHDDRYSMTDSDNLAKKEELIFSFRNNGIENPGLVISSRQTLLTTYLFYQGLAYSGNFAGYFASGIENGNKQMKNQVEKLWDKLGGIEVYLKQESGKWLKIDEIEEMGPIATDSHLVKLPAGLPPNATLKIRMTQGLWRIDYLALGNMVEKVCPITIHPDLVTRENNTDPESLALLSDTTNYLITYPGDEYMINFTLPDNGKYDFFLQTKGYYLEWMRDEWLAEQDLRKARFMFAFPGLYMRKAAKDFKKTEAAMENHFWGSRYVKN